MTIEQAQKRYPQIETELLLEHVLKKPKEYLFLHPKEKLTTAKQTKFTQLAVQRSKGQPIAYLLGYKYFYGLKFKVNKHVLIPRPETEWLVDRALEIEKARKPTSSKTSILDVGTGSGCIAVALAHALQNQKHAVTVTASDISARALEVAANNAKAHKVDMRCVQSDLFGRITGAYEIIIANLPYVPQGMYELLYHNLKFEPKVAITDGGEVWDIYARFFASLSKHLRAGGTALLEMDDGAKLAMQKMIRRMLPAWKVAFTKDLGGLWRHIELQKPTK